MWVNPWEIMGYTLPGTNGLPLNFGCWEMFLFCWVSAYVEGRTVSLERVGN